MVFSVFWAISPQMRTEDVCLFHKFFVILLTYYHNTYIYSVACIIALLLNLATIAQNEFFCQTLNSILAFE